METIKHAGCTIEIWQDSDCESPREWDNLGVMVLFHSRYSLANELDLRQKDYNGWGELVDAIRERLGDMLIMPVYMYDHSGVGLSTNNSQYPFNCPWDAGQVGYIAVSLTKVAEEFSSALMDEVERGSRVKGILKAEVETYSQWLNGECYGYTISCGGKAVDNCGGFIGYEACLEDAKRGIGEQTAPV